MMVFESVAPLLQAVTADAVETGTLKTLPPALISARPEPPEPPGFKVDSLTQALFGTASKVMVN